MEELIFKMDDFTYDKIRCITCRKPLSKYSINLKCKDCIRKFKGYGKCVYCDLHKVKKKGRCYCRSCEHLLQVEAIEEGKDVFDFIFNNNDRRG